MAGYTWGCPEFISASPAPVPKTHALAQRKGCEQFSQPLRRLNRRLSTTSGVREDNRQDLCQWHPARERPEQEPRDGQ